MYDNDSRRDIIDLPTSTKRGREGSIDDDTSAQKLLCVVAKSYNEDARSQVSIIRANIGCLEGTLLVASPPDQVAGGISE